MCLPCRRTTGGVNMEEHDPIAVALQEDVGQGDITSEFFVPEDLNSTVRVVAREQAIIAGVGTAAEVFQRVDPNLAVNVLRSDGTEVLGQEVILEVRGRARSILKAERVALNFLQRLSGIATLTRQFVDAAQSDHVKILDTRKTTPGLRTLA